MKAVCSLSKTLRIGVGQWSSKGGYNISIKDRPGGVKKAAGTELSIHPPFSVDDFFQFMR
jgi:hypothetical protein